MRALGLAAQQLGSRPRYVRHFAKNTAAESAIDYADRTLQDLCRLHGVEAAVKVSRGTWGLSLFRNSSSQQHQKQLHSATVQCTPTSEQLQAFSTKKEDSVVHQQFETYGKLEQPHRQQQANAATRDKDTVSQQTQQQEQQQHSNSNSTNSSSIKVAAMSCWYQFPCTWCSAATSLAVAPAQLTPHQHCTPYCTAAAAAVAAATGRCSLLRCCCGRYGSHMTVSWEASGDAMLRSCCRI
jgi:hypothetical protein